MPEISNQELKKNAEGYNDPTPYNAIVNSEKTDYKPVFRGGLYYVGDRIVLVVSNYLNNRYSNRIEVVYLTNTQRSNPLPTHVSVDVFETMTVHCEGIHTVKRDLIGRWIKSLTADEMKAIDKALAVSIGLSETWNENTTEAADDLIADDALVIIEAERNLYKNMYEQLLTRLLGEKRG